VTLENIQSLAASCPELEVFKVAILEGLPTKTYPEKHSIDPVVFDALAESFLSQPLQVLPRLKSFHVQALCRSYRKEYVNSESVRRLLPWLFAGMPILEDLHLGVCPMSLSNKGQTQYRFPEAPLLGRALLTLPSTIQQLSLREIKVEEADLVETLTPPSRFPNLKHIHLHMCGAEMLPAVRALKIHYSQLAIGICPATVYQLNQNRDLLPMSEGNAGVRLSQRVMRIELQRGFQLLD
jgi:hypothetical protein